MGFSLSLHIPAFWTNQTRQRSCFNLPFVCFSSNRQERGGTHNPQIWLSGGVIDHMSQSVDTLLVAACNRLVFASAFDRFFFWSSFKGMGCAIDRSSYQRQRCCLDSPDVVHGTEQIGCPDPLHGSSRCFTQAKLALTLIFFAVASRLFVFLATNFFG